MEKILLALDPQHIPMNAIDFACYLSRLTHSRLTGVFLEDVLSGGRPLLPFIAGDPYLDSMQMIAPGDPVEERVLTEENIRTFKEACSCRGVQTLIHRDRGVPTSEIIEESRFADIIVVGAEISFAQRYEAFPGRFVKDVLLESECPVIVAPYSFEGIDDILFAYSGTQSSVFAIKQFTYLFPELRQKRAIVVSVRPGGEDSLAEQFKMKEWMNHHYTDVEYVILKGEPSDQLFGYLIDRKNTIVVMGGYAKLIMKTINLPIFISHY